LSSAEQSAHGPPESAPDLDLPGMGAPATNGSPGVVASDFAESQRAGLAAVISLAKTDAPTRHPPTGEALAPQPEPSASPESRDASSKPAWAAEIITLSPPAIDQPRIPADPDPETLERLPSTGTQPSLKRGAAWNSQGFAYLEFPLLAIILTVQTLLSLRLVWSNTAFRGEAAYLSAGHVEIEHWLHGTPVPAYATYFSGAPVFYPPIGAAADSLGGLAAARILSLLFMLGTTFLLWSLTSKLFGRKAAVYAAALFAVLGPTLQFGAFATPDALGLLLLAASAWCIVSARDRDDSTLLLVAGTVLLAVANVTTYTTILFDLTIVALAGFTVAERRGLKAAVGRSGYVAAGVVALLCILFAVGGPLYLAGLLHTAGSGAVRGPALLIVREAGRGAGLVWVIAVAGVLLCLLLRRGWVQVMILAVLAASEALAVLDQIRTHSASPFSGHVDFGVWFAAAAAGYAIAQLSRIGSWKSLRIAVAVLVLIGVTLPTGMWGYAQASNFFKEWPNSVGLTSKLFSLIHGHPGNYLAENYNIPEYYLEGATTWQRWSDTSYFRYTPPGARHPLTGLAAYSAAIDRHYFSLVILDFEETAQNDSDIVADMNQTGSYHVVSVVPSSIGQYTIWAYQAPQRAGSRRGHH
jgi:hypothetical protein